MAFLVLCLIGLSLSDLKGLNTRSPWIAGMMLLLMVSMIGIPPFIGFFAKLNVLAALVATNETVRKMSANSLASDLHITLSVMLLGDCLESVGVGLEHRGLW